MEALIPVIKKYFLAFAMAAIPAVSAAETLFSENFSSYSRNVCFPDGGSFGPWRSDFSGYGCTQTEGDATGTWLHEQPQASVSSGETHANLAVGPSFSGAYTFTAKINTVAQLRKNNPPNSWEVAWVARNFTDNDHFYYFYPGTQGWELGKRDPAYPGGQRFLATGEQKFPIGRWYTVKVVQGADATMSVYVDGQLLTTFTDRERPYLSGRIGLYNEDSHVHFTGLQVESTGGSTSPPPVSAAPVSVDSTYSGYSISPIDDGVINAKGGTAATWASADNTSAHWITLNFSQPKQLNYAGLWWAYNATRGRLMTSQRVDVQYWNGSAFQTAASLLYPGTDEASSTARFSPITTTALRFYQPAGMGHPVYPNVMWVTEADYGLDQTAPVLSAISAGGIGQSSATITWTTDEASDSQVEYGQTTAYGQTSALSASQVTAHRVGLSYLSPGTAYHYRVKSRDAAGNLAVSPDTVLTTLPGSDITAPAVAITAPNSGAVLTFSPATISGTASDAESGVASVRLRLNGGSWFAAVGQVSWSSAAALSPGNNLIEAQSLDSAGNQSPIASVSVTLSVTPPTISAVSAGGITQTSANIAWTTNRPADTQVEFGPTTAYGMLSPLNASAMTAHSVALASLSPGTLYHYRVRSTDSVGNSAVSGDYTFTTLPSAAAECRTSAGTWQNMSFAAQSGTFGLEFDAVPNASGSDGVIGLSNGSASSYNSLAAIVRFNTAGAIDARNGGVYAAGASIPYRPGVSYHFRLSIDMAAHRYSVYVRPAGGSEQLLASRYAFRTEQSAATVLSNLAAYASIGSATVCRPSVGSPTAQNPVPQPGATPTALAAQKFLSQALADGVNDAATFGPAAEEVKVFDIRGHQVFSGSRQGGSGIVWNGKDGSGRIVDSGAYIARIKTQDAGVVYQSLAVVK
jgi:hypothetical protein